MTLLRLGLRTLQNNFPYRETGVAIPLSPCVSCGIADYRCYTPTFSLRKSGLSRSKERPNKGGTAKKILPLKPNALYPKDPTVLKILCHSKFTTRSKFTIAQWFTMVTPSCGRHCPWFYRQPSSQKRVHTAVNEGGVVKTLRHSNSLSRSVFSTAGSFG